MGSDSVRLLGQPTSNNSRSTAEISILCHLGSIVVGFVGLLPDLEARKGAAGGLQVSVSAKNIHQTSLLAGLGQSTRHMLETLIWML
ncbi:hypothetical protein AKJ16_DCAP14499 [Drosera capensis]